MTLKILKLKRPHCLEYWNGRIYTAFPLHIYSAVEAALSRMTGMHHLIRSSLGALEIAGSLSGVPYVGTIVIILQDIVECCHQVKVQKRKSHLLANKCSQLLAAFSEHAHRLEGSDLQQAVDEVTPGLERIVKRVRTFSGYSRVACFVKYAQIEEGLDRCTADLSTIVDRFNINAQIITHSTILSGHAEHRSNSAELRDLLHNILTSTNELRNVVEMQNAGEHVAETFMYEGQKELRRLRSHRNELLYSTIRYTSPLPSPQDSLPSPRDLTPGPQDSQRYLELQRSLISLHRDTGIPPSIRILDGEITKEGELPIAGGTFSDIWQGKWLQEEKVALKALRNIKTNDPRATKHFEKEMDIWAKLSHEHILAFYGVVTDLGLNIHMVSPWQDNGNVLQYVKQYPEANKISLLTGAAKGLEYLHSCGVVHGNVKCTNILVSSSGKACICDFGMSKVIEEVTEMAASATLTSCGSARWLAPELIQGSVTSPTMPSDTYSFAMAILELLTGKHPFSYRKRDASVIHDVVVLRKMPTKPDEVQLSDELWQLMQECWYSDATKRPPMSDVAARMIEIDAGIIVRGVTDTNSMSMDSS